MLSYQASRKGHPYRRRPLETALHGRRARHAAAHFVLGDKQSPITFGGIPATSNQPAMDPMPPHSASTQNALHAAYWIEADLDRDSDRLVTLALAAFLQALMAKSPG